MNLSIKNGIAKLKVFGIKLWTGLKTASVKFVKGSWNALKTFAIGLKNASIKFGKGVWKGMKIAGHLLKDEVKARWNDFKTNMKEHWAQFKADLKEAITLALAEALEKATAEDIPEVIEDIPETLDWTPIPIEEDIIG